MTGESAVHIICDISKHTRMHRDHSHPRAGAKLEALLRRKADPNTATHQGETALLLALKSGLSEAFDILLEYKADISVVSTSGMGVVAAATCGGSLVSLQKLRQLSVFVDWTKKFHLENTPFIMYSRGCFGPSGCNVLHAAAALGNLPVLTYLAGLPELSSNLDDATESGDTPLHLAAEGGSEENVRFLLQNGANKNAQTQDKATPLFRAAWHGHSKVVSVLVDAGAALISDVRDQSLEQMATMRGHQEVVDIITTASSTIVERFETTSRLLEELEHSIVRGDVGNCRAYIERGALKLGQFKCGCTPLICALCSERTEIATLLLDHNISTAGTACATHFVQNFPEPRSQRLSAAYVAIHKPKLNSLLGSLLAKCLLYEDHWAWTSPSLVYVAVEVNPAAIGILATHFYAHWEWYE